ncbi:MAG: hypothetical protein M1827_006615 [Pycnora praestabilis]|nr:MAG: hypothetical protein M1827_006615 [Pycnora praestabilis]
MTCSTNHSTWSSNYKRMTGDCTRLVAEQMIFNLTPPITSSSYILDNACGPGIVSEAIKHLHPNAKIMATDLSATMIEEVQKRIEAEGWRDMQTAIQDVRCLSSVSNETFTHAFLNFGILASGDEDDSAKAVGEIFRVLKVGGVALISSWAGTPLSSHSLNLFIIYRWPKVLLKTDFDALDRVWPIAFLNTARTIRPSSPPINKMAIKPEWMRGSWLAAQLENAGFGNNIEIRPYATHTSAGSMNDLVDNLLLAMPMFGGVEYTAEELEKAKVVFGEELRKLRTFEVQEDGDGGVRIGMKAFLGIGWKREDAKDVPA